LGAFIERYLEERGFSTQRQPLCGDRFNVLAQKGQGGRALLLSGHMDTVPAAEGWETDPWTPRIDGDRLFGLGACDMKGGLCAMLQAVEDVEPHGYTLKMAFLADEENISEGMHVLSQSGALDGVVAVLVPELGSAGPQEVGPRMLTLGRRGRVDLDIRVRGRATHAAYPEAGVSAALRAATLALALERLPLERHPQLGPSSATLRDFVSRAKGLSLPDVADLRIDRHLVPPETPESARRDMEHLVELLYQEGQLSRADDMPITVAIPARRTPYLQPYATSQHDPFAQLVETVVRERLGAVIYNYGLSVADENVYGAVLDLPVVVVGPAGGNSHAPDEWVSVASVEQLTDIYRAVLQEFLGALQGA